MDFVLKPKGLIMVLKCLINLSLVRSMEVMELSFNIQYTVPWLTNTVCIYVPTRGKKSLLFSLKCHITTVPSSPLEYK